jgi:hypothetical protein
MSSHARSQHVDAIGSECRHGPACSEMYIITSAVSSTIMVIREAPANLDSWKACEMSRTALEFCSPKTVLSGESAKEPAMRAAEM